MREKARRDEMKLEEKKMQAKKKHEFTFVGSNET
jgi:hypothetical protein